MKKITMQQIADQLGISKNSVSLALRKESGISEETRKLVLKKAEELGYDYKKNNVSGKKIKSIAFIASEFVFSPSLVNRSFFNSIYMSLQQEITDLNWELVLQPIIFDQMDTMTLPSYIEEKKIDGIIILSHLTNAYTNAILATGIPTVVIDHHYPEMQADAILINNRFGAYTITKHLIDLGHKEIGFIGNVKYSPSYQERLEGYLLAIEKADLPKPDEKFVKSDVTETDTDVCTYLDSLDKQPTAWFCVNDGLAFYTYSYLQQNQFQIPNDISLTCYDNGDLSQLAHPNITTMDIDLHYYSKCAFNQLVWRMENPSEPYREILLPSTLLKRGSSGKAPR